MLGTQLISEVLSTLVHSGNTGVAQEFFGCCGPNQKQAYESSDKAVRDAVMTHSQHDSKMNPRVTVRVFNTLARMDRCDLVIGMCNSQIGSLGYVEKWCSKEAAAAVRHTRNLYKERKKGEKTTVPSMQQRKAEPQQQKQKQQQQQPQMQQQQQHLQQQMLHTR